MSIYHWKLGDIALARICKKVYAKVKVVKDDEGLFYDDKVLAITPNKDGSLNTKSQLCYFVEISRTGEKLWVPYTSLHLAGRSRPFYGTTKATTTNESQKSALSTPKKRKGKEEHPLPLPVKLAKPQDPDLNTTFDTRSTPVTPGKYENAFNEFVRRGKDMLFDNFFAVLERDKENCLEKQSYLSTNASTEDKFECIIRNVVSEKEIDHYLHQCWRYNFLNRQLPVKTPSSEGSDSNGYKAPKLMAMLTNRAGESVTVKPFIEAPSSPEKQSVTVHLPFCLVCGKGQKLRECVTCPASFHPTCRREWLVTIIHRKNLPQKQQKMTTFVDKILSSTRAVCRPRAAPEPAERGAGARCPSCVWGPRVGYSDVVWHKLGGCPWWPARVLPPGALPACLAARAHRPAQWPLRYYGTENYAWGDANRMCLFLPSHMAALDSRPDDVKRACHDACDDYIVVYLT